MIIVNPYSFYSPPPRSDELFHHGIKGQKWGHMNGPPYPLGASDHSASEKKAGWRRSLKKSSQADSNQNRQRKGLSDKQKRALKIGAAAVGVALIAGGTAYAVKTGKIQLPKRIPSDIPFVDGIKKPESANKRLSAINPYYKMADDGHRMNCGNCVIANEMRHRMYDVCAIKNPSGMIPGKIEELFTGFKSESFLSLDDKIDLFKFQKLPQAEKGTYIRDTISSNILKQYPEGARGALEFFHTGGGHYMSWEVKNGSVIFEDPQSGPGQSIVNLAFQNYHYVKNGTGSQCIRFDDLSIREEAIERFVENRRQLTKFSRMNDDDLEFVRRGSNFIAKHLY